MTSDASKVFVFDNRLWQAHGGDCEKHRNRCFWKPATVIRLYQETVRHSEHWSMYCSIIVLSRHHEGTSLFAKRGPVMELHPMTSGGEWT